MDSCSFTCLQAECEALRAEAVKWEDDAKSLCSMHDVSTLNFRYTLPCLSCTLHVAILYQI